MERFATVTGPAIPLGLANVDTDVIISFEHLKVLTRAGLGAYGFAALRYRQDNSENPESVFNLDRYRGAPILIAGANFACGSSREHAAWAMHEMGIRVVLAESVADIFAGNATKNGILAVELPASVIYRLIAVAPTHDLRVDLEQQRVSAAGVGPFHFEIDPARKTALLEGRDDIAVAELLEDDIARYEARLTADRAWAVPA